jgi:hypothetical protein
MARDPGTHWIGKLSGPRVFVDAEADRKTVMKDKLRQDKTRQDKTSEVK